MSTTAIEIKKSFHHLEVGSSEIIRTIQGRLLAAFVISHEHERIDIDTLEPTFGSLNMLVNEIQRSTDDTSETLQAVSVIAEDICDHFTEVMNSGGDIASAWSALYAWDVARSAETEELVHKVLREFRGAAQPRLLDAYIRARDNGTSIDVELDQLNDSNRSAIFS